MFTFFLIQEGTYFFLLTVVDVLLVKTTPCLSPGNLLWLLPLLVHSFRFLGRKEEVLSVTTAAHGTMSWVDTVLREGAQLSLDNHFFLFWMMAILRFSAKNKMLGYRDLKKKDP